MAEYHVGCGAFGIYAGTLEPRNKTLWRNKSDVTHEALCATAQHLLFNGIEFRFKHKGQWYAMRIAEMEGEQECHYQNRTRRKNEVQGLSALGKDGKR